MLRKLVLSLLKFVDKVENCDNVIQEDILYNILKQCSKIKKDPSDIKTEDLKKVVDRWHMLDKDRKTDEVVAAYNVVLTYIEANQIAL